MLKFRIDRRIRKQLSLVFAMNARSTSSTRTSGTCKRIKNKSTQARKRAQGNKNVWFFRFWSRSNRRTEQKCISPSKSISFVGKGQRNQVNPINTNLLLITGNRLTTESRRNR